MLPGSTLDPVSVEKPFDRRHWCVIFVATLVAAALRMYELGEWSLWIDEAHTWRDATMPLTGEGSFMAEQRRFYPLSFFLLRFLFGVGALGFDEWSLRLPFAVIGIITVPVLAVCGRRLVGAWPAVIAACLLAVNPWHLFWSQNARGYSLVVLAAALATHRMYVLYGSERVRDLVLSVLFVLIGAASHPAALVIVTGFFGFLFVARMMLPQVRLGMLKVVVCVVVVFVVLPWFVRHFTPFSHFYGSKNKASVVHWMATSLYYFRPSALLAMVLALLIAPRAIGRSATLYLGCIVVLPLLALTSIGNQLVLVTARYAICVLPALTLLIGLLIVDVARRLRESTALSRGMAWGFAAVMPLLVIGDYVQLDVKYYVERYGNRGRWREAAEFIREEAAQRGFKGARALGVNYPSLFYYLRPRHWFVGDTDPHPNFVVKPIVQWRFATGENRGRKLHEPGAEAHFAWHREEAKSKGQLFAVQINEPYLRAQDPDGKFEAVLKRDFELALYLPCWIGPKDDSIYVYLPKVDG